MFDISLLMFSITRIRHTVRLSENISFILSRVQSQFLIMLLIRNTFDTKSILVIHLGYDFFIHYSIRYSMDHLRK